VLDYAEGQPLRLYVDLGQREVPRTVDLVTPLRTHDERELIPGRDALWGPALDAKALQALREAARLELVDGQTLARSELTETAAPFPLLLLAACTPEPETLTEEFTETVVEEGSHSEGDTDADADADMQANTGDTGSAATGTTATRASSSPRACPGLRGRPCILHVNCTDLTVIFGRSRR
jgi:hypothetical protein